MIRCKKCGSKNLAYELRCPFCSWEFALYDDEIAKLLREAKEAKAANQYEHTVNIYRFLAGIGVCEGEREFAVILERGMLVPRNLDMAMKYFYAAATKGDSFSAYRYSILASRTNEALGQFWLGYSAILGCKEAYNDAWQMYIKLGDDSSASYYCSLMAESGDIDSIVEMARRHLYGLGVEQNESYAKWYINKLSFPPIYSLKLVSRLKNAEAAEPPKPKFENRDKVLRALINQSRKYGQRTALQNLSEIFAESEAPDAAVSLANLFIEGVEYERDVEHGIALLEKAVEKGSAMGAKCLGDLFAIGKHVERDAKRAIGYYKHAASLGTDGAFEAIGDVFMKGEIAESDPAFALELYEKGAEEGDRSCEKKAFEIKRDREKHYFDACAIEKNSPKSAFPLFEMSVKAGYPPAHAKIGRYYEFGIGTEKNRKLAFKHYKHAVDIGDKRALLDLGRCYASGIGVAFNFKLASKYLSMAKELGQSGADSELYRIYENKKRHMTRALYSTAMRLLYNKKYDIAIRQLQTCSQLGYPAATYSIGCLYEFGIGFPSDRRTALNYYKKAYRDGYSDSDQSHKQKILKMSK